MYCYGLSNLCILNYIYLYSASPNVVRDIFQPLYPTVSEEATEEALHWEPTDEMEFDEEFKFTGPTTLVKEAIQSMPKQVGSIEFLQF